MLSLMYCLNLFVINSCAAAAEMLVTNADLRRKWNSAVEWLHDELERVNFLPVRHVNYDCSYRVQLEALH